jgi:hypothetical protein
MVLLRALLRVLQMGAPKVPRTVLLKVLQMVPPMVPQMVLLRVLQRKLQRSRRVEVMVLHQRDRR